MDYSLVAIPCVTLYVISVMHAYRLGIRRGRSESTYNVHDGGSLTVPSSTTVTNLNILGGRVEMRGGSSVPIRFRVPGENPPEPVDRRPEPTPAPPPCNIFSSRGAWSDWTIEEKLEHLYESNLTRWRQHVDEYLRLGDCVGELMRRVEELEQASPSDSPATPRTE